MHFVEKEPNQKREDFDKKLKSNKIFRNFSLACRNLEKNYYY